MKRLSNWSWKWENINSIDLRPVILFVNPPVRWLFMHKWKWLSESTVIWDICRWDCVDRNKKYVSNVSCRLYIFSLFDFSKWSCLITISLQTHWAVYSWTRKQAPPAFVVLRKMDLRAVYLRQTCQPQPQSFPPADKDTQTCRPPLIWAAGSKTGTVQLKETCECKEVLVTNYDIISLHIKTYQYQ